MGGPRGIDNPGGHGAQCEGVRQSSHQGTHAHLIKDIILILESRLAKQCDK